MVLGCITAIEQHLPILMGLLINSLADPKVRYRRRAELRGPGTDLHVLQPLVRSITCWTIGRYSSWTIKEGATPEHKGQFFVPAMEGVRLVLARTPQAHS